MSLIGKYIRDLLQITTAPDNVGIEVQRKDSPTQTEYIEKSDFLKEVYQDIGDHVQDIDDPHDSVRITESKPTGLWDGGELNINPPNEVEVLAGAGIIIDSYTNPLSKPTEKIVRWDQINTPVLAAPEVSGSLVFLTIEATSSPHPSGGLFGHLKQYSTAPEPEVLKDEIYLGLLVHNGDGWGEVSSPTVVNNVAHAFDEFLNRVLGPTFIIDGGGVTEAALHTLDRAAGLVWELNRNWHVDKKDPHREPFNATIGIQWRYVDRNMVTQPLTGTVNATMYDADGSLTSIGGNSNRTSIQRVYIDPRDNIWVLWGQNVYESFAEALALIGADTAETSVPQIMQSSVLVGYIVSERTKVDWDADESRFLTLSGVGSANAGGAPITNHNLLAGREIYPAHQAQALAYEPTTHNSETDVQNAITHNSALLAEGTIHFSASITDDAGLGTPHQDLAATDFTGHTYADLTIPTALLIETNKIVTFYHKGVAYAWVGPKPVTVGIGGNYIPLGPDIDLAPTGVGNHPDLSERDALDQHPAASIGNSADGDSLIDHYNDTGIHANHTAIEVVAGAGLQGGGDITQSRMVSVGTPSIGMQINADSIEVVYPGSGGDIGLNDNSARGDHLHDGRYYTESEIDAILDALVLDDLFDTTILTPSDGEKLTYNGVTNQWENAKTLEHLGIVFYGYNIDLPPNTLPVSGKVSRNTNDVTLTTELYINILDSSGLDVSEYWGEIDGGDGLGFWSPDGSVRENYRVMSAGVLNADVWTFTVEYINHSGGDLLAGNQIRLLWRSNPPDDFMRWKNIWAGDEHSKSDTVRDEGWVMVANKTTTDRPSPQPVGAPIWFHTDVPAWLPLSYIGVVRAGLRITNLIDAYQVLTIRVWIATVTADAHYRIVQENLITGNISVSQAFLGTVLDVPGWFEVPLDPVFMLPGADIIVYANSSNSAANQEYNHPWQYVGSSNQEVDPGTSNASRRGDHTTIRINKFDNDAVPVDRSAELAAVITGSTISITAEASASRFIKYEVTAPETDMGTWVSYPVTLVETGALGEPVTEPCQIYFVNPILTSTDYVKITDHFIGSAQITGILQLDDTLVVEDENSYGVDVQVQEYIASPDWDLLTPPSGTGGSGGDSGGGETIHNLLTGRDVADTHPTSSIKGLDTALSNKEPSISPKNSAFNKNFAGSGVATDVSRSDHGHSGDYEPVITPKGTAFNKNFAGNGAADTVNHSDHNHDAAYAPIGDSHPNLTKVGLGTHVSLVESTQVLTVDQITESDITDLDKYTQAEVDTSQLAQDSNISDNASNLTAHLNDALDAHDASVISYIDTHGISATDVQLAIDTIAEYNLLGIEEFAALADALIAPNNIWDAMNQMDWLGHQHADTVVTTALKVQLNHVLTCGNHSGTAYRFIGSKKDNGQNHRLIGSGAVGAGFTPVVEADFVAISTSDHGLLDNTHNATDGVTDAHDILAINGLQVALDGKEAVLGNPAADTYVLQSTILGVRTWQPKDTGPTGPQGPQGDKGEKGDQGIQGVQGVTGADGADGIDGAIGPIGPIGPDGQGITTFVQNDEPVANIPGDVWIADLPSNLLSSEDASFEGGTAGNWIINGSVTSIAASADWASDGVNSLKVDASSSNPSIRIAQEGMIPVVVGQVFSMGLDVFVPEDCEINLFFRYYKANQSTAVDTLTTSINVLASTITRLESLNFTVPVDAEFAGAIVRCDLFTAGNSYYIDKVTIKEGADADWVHPDDLTGKIHRVWDGANWNIIDGNDGDDGVDGSQGDQGIQGPAGEKGDKGDQGIPGNDGAKGDTGATGPAGAKGDQGIQGVQGNEGATGPAGPSEISAILDNALELDTANPKLIYLDPANFAAPTHQHTLANITDAKAMAGVDNPASDVGYVRKGAVWVPEAGASLVTGRKNKLINGGLLIWQRGTSISSASGLFAADRWASNYGSMFMGLSNDGTNRHMNMRATTDRTNLAIRNPIELYMDDLGFVSAYPYVIGSTWTISYEVLPSNGSCFENLGLGFADDSAGTNYTAVTFSNNTQTGLSTANWTKIVHTFTVGVAPLASSRCLAVIVGIDRATNLTINSNQRIRNIQLEQGSVATEFEAIDITEELSRCYRYYLKQDIIVNIPVPNSGSSYRFGRSFPTPMRVIPDIDNSGVTYNNASNGGAQNATKNFYEQFTVASSTATTRSEGEVIFDAEL